MAVTTNPYKHYVPSVPAAIIASIVFALLTAAHGFLLFRSRKWFTTAIFIGGLFEMIGFAARADSHYHLDSKTPYIIQVLLILLAPILFAASVYMFLGRLVRAAGGQQYSIIRVTWLTKIFVIGDIFCFLVQAAGASMLVNATDKDGIDRGQNIILGGLVLQILFFILFITTAVIWHVRVRSQPLWQYCASSGLNLSRTLWSLYLVGVLITLRNIYRPAEYKGGQNGYLLEHEWPAYALDAFLMAIVMATTLLWYSVELRPKNSEAGWNLQGVGMP
ncbi:RTA1 like protein-domain-containing protein [Exophiala viscosa]|uniref:RTA1 like protein-domain-containing protein n=1 Tax=Exophiala viscosa TaxID=2486360 RepID=UPI00219150F5|nr:RTA1 like protein-domain-containing protein [Exophiala viscosa]